MVFGGGEMIELGKISGIGEWEVVRHGEQKEDLIYKVPAGKAFLVVRPKTIELRCDQKLAQKLREDYESVMESRYFGRGGIEIVPSGQLAKDEIADLVRLSYNLTQESSAHEA